MALRTSSAGFDPDSSAGQYATSSQTAKAKLRPRMERKPAAVTSVVLPVFRSRFQRVSRTTSRRSASARPPAGEVYPSEDETESQGVSEMSARRPGYFVRASWLLDRGPPDSWFHARRQTRRRGTAHASPPVVPPFRSELVEQPKGDPQREINGLSGPLLCHCWLIHWCQKRALNRKLGVSFAAPRLHALSHT
jgi:hypothetical protein